LLAELPIERLTVRPGAGRLWGAKQRSVGLCGLQWRASDCPGCRPGSPEQRRSVSRQTAFKRFPADVAALARHTVTTAMDPAPEFVVHWHLTELNKRLPTCLGINRTTCTQ
jgi:hypothetical protein